MKFTQMRYREKQSEWFGKRGMSWHISCVLSKPAVGGHLELVSYVHLGPVSGSLVSANRWLRGIKTYRFPWYLTLVSANHASSNAGLFDSCSQDSFAVYAIVVDLLKNAKAVKPQITGALLRSDGKGCYHSNTLIAPLHCIYELSGIKPLR